MIMFLCIYVVVIEPHFLNFFCKWPMTYELSYCQTIKVEDSCIHLKVFVLVKKIVDIKIMSLK